MSDVQLSLTPVDALPEKEHRAGPVGRPSPYTPILEQVRAAGAGQAYRITAEPLPLKPNRAGQIAARIRNGGLAGVHGGEFKASDKDGHVFVEYVGQSGIDEYNAAEPERKARSAKRAANKAQKAQAASGDVEHDVDDDVTPGVTEAAPAATPAFASAGADTSGW